MSGSNLSQIVRSKIAAIKGIDERSFSEGNSIKDDLGVTSMEYITILTEVAALLDIDLMRFSEKEIISARTVGDLEQVLASKLNK